MASFTERYHELTKYNPHTIDKLGPVHWDQQPPAFKPISSKTKIDLLSRLQAVMDHLEDAAKAAESPEAGLEEIARLLFFTLGLTARLPNQGDTDYFLRAAPSAGGLYPTELYVAARNQSGLPDGIYHYHSLKSALIPVWQGSFWGDLKHYFRDNPAVDSSNLIFLFTGTYARSAWRYKERAYRRILLDTGHALGNLLEVCRRDGLDFSVMGGFEDEGLEELLFLTPKEEFPLLGVAVGPQGALAHRAGQLPGPVPAEAIKQLTRGNADRTEGSDEDYVVDPMQVQQNACERIPKGMALRPAPLDADPGTPFAKTQGHTEVTPGSAASLTAGRASPPASSEAETASGGASLTGNTAAASTAGDQGSTASASTPGNDSDVSIPEDAPPSFNVLKGILSRRSCRKFNSAVATMEQLKSVLAYAYRCDQSLASLLSTGCDQSLASKSSAGGDQSLASLLSTGREPSLASKSSTACEGNAWALSGGHLHFHIVALRVDGLESGVYAFDPADLSLTQSRVGDFTDDVYGMCLGQDLAADCSFALVHTAHLAELVAAYGDRGYRYACLDAGQIGERVNLWADHVGLGSSGIGGYYDDQANELLDLPLAHGIVYITLVGVPVAA